MAYSITTKDGITINNIPDDVDPNSGELRARVSNIRDVNSIPGMPAPQPQRPEPALVETAIGTGEAALSVATGATGGALGFVGGTIKGIIDQVSAGRFGTDEAMRLIEQEAIKGAQLGTYAPRTESGQRQAQAVGEMANMLPPVLPILAPEGALLQGARMTAPIARQAVTKGAEAASTLATKALDAIPRPPQSQPSGFGALSVGAGQAPTDIQRITSATQMPVPFEGKSALTAGQATRDFSQLQFEKESAKLADIGEPLRERAQNQTVTMIQNFDALIDQLEPQTMDVRDLGKVVDKVLVNKATGAKKRIDAAYKAARANGEMQQPVELTSLPVALQNVDRFRGLVNIIEPIENFMIKKGALIKDENGDIRPGIVSLEDSETIRQFINEATDWSNGRETIVAKQLKSAIDQATEGKGGEMYKKARKLRENYANEFENVGLTAKLLGTKRGTDERQIAFSDVFDKVVLISPVEEMNKLRGTLLTSGKEGRQVWKDLKAAGINYIKEQSLSGSQKDAAGNEVVLVSRMNSAIKSLDRDGKLESLYGKKQAQMLRDLGDLAIDIFNAPPGAVNHSNTASALMVAMDSLVGFGTTGIPAPYLTVIREALKYSKNKAVKARIAEALRYSTTRKN